MWQGILPHVHYATSSSNLVPKRAPETKLSWTLSGARGFWLLSCIVVGVFYYVPQYRYELFNTMCTQSVVPFEGGWWDLCAPLVYFISMIWSSRRPHSHIFLTPACSWDELHAGVKNRLLFFLLIFEPLMTQAQVLQYCHYFGVISWL